MNITPPIDDAWKEQSTTDPKSLNCLNINTNTNINTCCYHRNFITKINSDVLNQDANSIIVDDVTPNRSMVDVAFVWCLFLGDSHIRAFAV
jgi:hypothetical protein